MGRARTKSTGIIVLFVACGCIPARYVHVPAVHGRVIDAVSRPVAGAMIELVPTAVNGGVPGRKTPSVATAADGTFARPEVSEFFFYIPPTDFAAFPCYTVVVSTPGHSVPTTQVSGGVRMLGRGPSAAGVDLGDLQIR